MSVDRRAANQKMLAEADDTQQKTKEAILRIQQQTAQTESLGTATLEELRAQGRQMDDINMEVQNVNAKLDTASHLQDRFDAWSGNIFGFKKRAANREAAAEIASKQAEEMMKVKEVFENEKYDMLSRIWKPAGLVLCSNPATKVPDLFDPATQSANQYSKWAIDFSLTGIDAEGWTYGPDMNYLNKHGVGHADAKWNSYARRRKWKYNEKTGNEVVDGIRSRNAERIEKSRPSATQAEKIGYVSRNNVSAMKASGYSSTSKSRGKGKEDDLDDESRAGLEKIKANDAEIDAGISEISRTLDSISGIASLMKEETISHNKKLENIEDNMQKAGEKQTVVNARQRRFLG